jgi:hypothetical protein
VGGGARLKIYEVWLWGGGQAKRPALFLWKELSAVSFQLSAKKWCGGFDWLSFCPGFEVPFGPYLRAWRGMFF